MLKQIRRGVFETNSSSVHSICITKDDIKSFPKSIHFGLDYFGWNEDIVGGNQLADYLYTAILSYKLDEAERYLEFIKATLDKFGIAYTFADSHDPCCADCGIDHDDRTKSFVSAVCSDENKLMRYLFGANSCVYTGNDNDCEYNSNCFIAYNENHINRDDSSYEYIKKGN